MLSYKFWAVNNERITFCLTTTSNSRCDNFAPFGSQSIPKLFFLPICLHYLPPLALKEHYVPILYFALKVNFKLNVYFALNVQFALNLHFELKVHFTLIMSFALKIHFALKVYFAPKSPAKQTSK